MNGLLAKKQKIGIFEQRYTLTDRIDTSTEKDRIQDGVKPT